MIDTRHPALLVAFIAVVALLGTAVIAGASLAWEGEDIPLLAALTALAVVCEIADFSPFPNSRSSLSVALILAAGTVSGLPGVAVVASVAAIADFAAHRKAFDQRIVPSLSKATFNLGALLISGAAYVGVLEAFSSTRDPGDWVASLGPGLLGAAAAFALNSSLLALAISLETGRRPVDVWNLHCRWALPHFLLFGVLAVFLAAAYDRWDLAGLAVLLAPLCMAWLAMKQHADRASRADLIIRH